MDATQFAMVEELASLIKDNLYSKHLVLSTEETLITILQHQYHSSDDEDADEDNRVGSYRGTNRNIIELQPASSYQRLLLHRLADIYGPPVLISDVILEYDNNDTSMSVVLMRKDTAYLEEACMEDVNENISAESSHLKNDADLKVVQQPAELPALSLEEREAAYRAAHERIFSTQDAVGKDIAAVKPRHVPAVAQRMIAHALGKKVESPRETTATVNGKGKEAEKSSRNKIKPGKEDSSYVGSGRSRSHPGNPPKQSWLTGNNSRAATSSSPEELKREQVGAAKRMFANALRLTGAEGREGPAWTGK
ncbi:hypothetical protein GUJ93_ZPchr0008g13735 [Zizania palustris]|uniref:SUZ domain-containing protein n=1 Tax=Zizania palustris TaxID=103762 RepID=A0A8J5RJR9_ZIZPA|nr:hypothetical protein GUJ93_ZPchr0008g13735 [Zizania palustris]